MVRCSNCASKLEYWYSSCSVCGASGHETVLQTVRGLKEIEKLKIYNQPSSCDIYIPNQKSAEEQIEDKINELVEVVNKIIKER